jgi:predicted phosphodiesterase
VRRGERPDDPHPRHYTPQAVARIQSLRPKIFIAGHSHILKVIYDPVYDLLHLNPGAAGCYGFHKVRSALRFTIDGTDIRDMEIGEWPRPGA